MTHRALPNQTRVVLIPGPAAAAASDGASADDRRAEPRLGWRRRCVVHDPVSRQYIRGLTRDVSESAVRVELERAIVVGAGDRVFVGLSGAWRRRGARELVEARVVRASNPEAGYFELALLVREAPAALGFVAA